MKQACLVILALAGLAALAQTPPADGGLRAQGTSGHGTTGGRMRRRWSLERMRRWLRLRA